MKKPQTPPEGTPKARSHMKFEVRLLLLLVYGHEYDSLERSKGYRQQISRHGAFKNLRKYFV